MGSATHICSDKTGTLTQNKMTVMACMINSTINQITDQNDIPKLFKDVKEQGVNTINEIGLDVWNFILNSTMWNSSAFFIKVTQDMVENDEQFKNKKAGDWATKGNVTEQATLNFFLNQYDGQELVNHKKSLDDIQENIIAFTSARKKASIIVKTDSGYRMYTKGGPDFLGSAVTKIVGSDGNTCGMDDEVPADAILGDGNTG